MTWDLTGGGQFISVDPQLDPGVPAQFNAYVYSGNNPLTWSDPTGLFWGTAWNVIKGVGSGVYGLGQGVAQMTNPINQIKTVAGLPGLARENGGGWGGWYSATTITFNPMYSALVAGDSAIQNGKQGNVQAAARDWTSAAGITAGTALGAKGGVGAVKGKMAATPKTATPEPVTPKPAAKLATPEPAANSTVTMGRAMESRVIPYATEHGYGYYAGTPKFIPRSLDRVAPNTLKKVDLWFNKRWINTQMRQGNKMVDIGEPPGIPPSDFYDMERGLTNGYWNYVQDIQP